MNGWPGIIRDGSRLRHTPFRSEFCPALRSGRFRKPGYWPNMKTMLPVTRSSAPSTTRPVSVTDHTSPVLAEQIQHLMIAVEVILRDNHEGLSELALIKSLQRSPWHLLGPVHFSDPSRLYPVHFLVFHALYRLRDELGSQGETLSISPLSIRLRAMDVVAGTGPPAHADPLRAFYLDLSKYELSKAAIGRMMEDFWSGQAGREPAPEEALEAAAILGFGELPESLDIVKHRFRRAVMQAHPDRGGDTARVQVLNEAFALLRRHFSRPDSASA